MAKNHDFEFGDAQKITQKIFSWTQTCRKRQKCDKKSKYEVL